MVTERLAVSGIVLAGGRATRMGGIDKGLVTVAGRPLIAHVLERLRPQVDDIVINANRNQGSYAVFSWPVATDADSSFSGPLAGIAAALPHCRQEWALVVACDCPLLPENLAAALRSGMQPGDLLAVAHDGQRLQPLFMLLHRSLLTSLRDAIAIGELKVENWIHRQAFATVQFADPLAFSNINTDVERQALEKVLPDKMPGTTP